ncbi:hypothetical protein [Lentilactobacillus fungorum]|nr:hypothetical protein [Lentilactobacillus fungorum]
MMFKRAIFSAMVTLLFAGFGMIIAIQPQPITVLAKKVKITRTSAPKIEQYFDPKIVKEQQQMDQREKELSEKGIQATFVPLPCTAFIKAPVGSRVVIRQQSKTLYNKVIKDRVVLWKTNVTNHKFYMDAAYPVDAYAKLPKHKVSKVVHFKFEAYPSCD